MNICVNSLTDWLPAHSLYAEEVLMRLTLLFSAVENGDQNCIDLLCIFALRNDDPGIELRTSLIL